MKYLIGLALLMSLMGCSGEKLSWIPGQCYTNPSQTTYVLLKGILDTGTKTPWFNVIYLFDKYEINVTYMDQTLDSDEMEQYVVADCEKAKELRWGQLTDKQLDKLEARIEKLESKHK